MAEELKKKIKQANETGLSFLVKSQPEWVDVMPLKEFLPDLKENTILHAGPPMDPAKASVPFKNAVSGASVVEGLAKSTEEAWDMILKGEIMLASQLDHKGASGAAYALGPNSPVQIAEDKQSGNRAFCGFQEGPSRNVLRWGVYNDEVHERLIWFRDELGPVMQEIIRESGGINIKNILAKATAMGDENHSRQAASTSLLLQELMAAFVKQGIKSPSRQRVAEFLLSADRFFLHVFIAGAAAVMENLKGLDYCTLLIGQGGNGTDFGTKFAFSGNDWYTADGVVCEGLYINPEWNESHGVPYLGDSCVVETFGFGGNAAAAGPMVTYLTGGDFEEAMRRTSNAAEFCIGRHDWAPIPVLNMQGPPVGIDLRKVLATGITPICHGGMHHIEGGQAGAGYMNVPMECFKKAIRAFAAKYNM